MWTTAQRAEDALYVGQAEAAEVVEPLNNVAFALAVAMAALCTFGLGLVVAAALGV